MEIAADLFLERGYSPVTMQDIADKCELTKGGVYGHFRSKGQLLVEVIRWKHATREHSAEFLETVRDPDRAIELLFDDVGRPIRLLEVDAASTARHDPDITAGMATLDRERQTAGARAALAHVVSDPQTMAWIVMALSMGIGMKEAITFDKPALARFRGAIRAWVVPDPR